MQKQKTFGLVYDFILTKKDLLNSFQRKKDFPIAIKQILLERPTSQPDWLWLVRDVCTVYSWDFVEDFHNCQQLLEAVRQDHRLRDNFHWDWLMHLWSRMQSDWPRFDWKLREVVTKQCEGEVRRYENQSECTCMQRSWKNVMALCLTSELVTTGIDERNELILRKSCGRFYRIVNANVSVRKSCFR